MSKTANESGVTSKTQETTKKPPLYKVLFHNDDYTTMEFVVDVLKRHFAKSDAEAVFVMLQVHHKGSGVAGVYTRDVAETKVERVTTEAREEGMPLKLTAEPVEPAAGETP